MDTTIAERGFGDRFHISSKSNSANSANSACSNNSVTYYQNSNSNGPSTTNYQNSGGAIIFSHHSDVDSPEEDYTTSPLKPVNLLNTGKGKSDISNTNPDSARRANHFPRSDIDTAGPGRRLRTNSSQRGNNLEAAYQAERASNLARTAVKQKKLAVGFSNDNFPIRNKISSEVALHNSSSNINPSNEDLFHSLIIADGTCPTLAQQQALESSGSILTPVESKATPLGISGSVVGNQTSEYSGLNSERSNYYSNHTNYHKYPVGSPPGTTRSNISASSIFNLPLVESVTNLLRNGVSGRSSFATAKEDNNNSFATSSLHRKELDNLADGSNKSKSPMDENDNLMKTAISDFSNNNNLMKTAKSTMSSGSKKDGADIEAALDKADRVFSPQQIKDNNNDENKPNTGQLTIASIPPENDKTNSPEKTDNVRSLIITGVPLIYLSHFVKFIISNWILRQFI